MVARAGGGGCQGNRAGIAQSSGSLETSFWVCMLCKGVGQSLYFRALLTWSRPPLGGAVHCAAAKNNLYKGIMGIEKHWAEFEDLQ